MTKSVLLECSLFCECLEKEAQRWVFMHDEAKANDFVCSPISFDFLVHSCKQALFHIKLRSHSKLCAGEVSLNWGKLFSYMLGQFIFSTLSVVFHPEFVFFVQLLGLQQICKKYEIY